MKKVLITKKFKDSDGNIHNAGEVAELEDSIAQQAVDKGFGQWPESDEDEDIPSLGEGGGGSRQDSGSSGPFWSSKIGISEKRNIDIAVWQGDDYPSITIRENRKDDDGNWDSTKFYLPTGASLLVMSEALKEAFKKVQTLRD